MHWEAEKSAYKKYTHTIMNKINRLTDNQLSQGEVNDILEEVITKQLDREFVRSFESKLKDRGIFKNGQTASSPLGAQLKSRGIVAAIVITLALIFAYHLSKTEAVEPEELAREYAVQYPMNHPGLSKSSTIDQTRNQAILQYNRGNYEESLALFSLLEQKTGEDNFFMGMASLRIDQFTNAGIYFGLSMDDNNYQQESRFFLGLTLILEGQLTSAIEILKSISKDDFGYNDALQLLSHLNAFSE